MAAIAAAVVGVVLGKLADLLINKAHELKDVRKQIEQVQLDLRLIEALLRGVDSMRNRNELVTEWLNQVREIADRINSVIDTFRVKIEENQNRPECSNCTCFTKITMSVNREYKTYKLGLRDDLNDIIDQVRQLHQRRTDFRINDLGAIDDVDDPDPDPDPEPSDKVDDPEVVGLKDDMAKIIEQLLDTNITRRTVLSIVGTGGLGKTTLAQKVFKSEKLEGHFNCRAWLSISQKYNLNDLWREILYSVEPRMKKKIPPITDGDLLVKLKSSLRPKRYLIILDDVWDIDFWEQLEIALPDPDNASRVIITTRSLEVGKAADCNTDLYKLDYLNDAEGLALLFRRAFQEHIQPEKEKKYPDHLLEVATRLTKKCGGLPLALVVLGGILSRRDRTYNAWNKVYETMDWHDKDGEKLMKLLGKSYEDLPPHLKSCFLYFSSFPEDYTISRRHVIGMWMAEEFVPTSRRGTMEDKAEKYFEELVQRCLIQVTKRSWNGNYKYCSMHDLLRDLAIRKAKEENNFFTVFSKAEEDVNQLAAIKPLRAALQFCTLTENGVYSENTRSLLCLDNGENSSKDCGFGLLNYSGFRLLRVLTLEHVDMRKFASGQWPKEWLHLRYFGLRGCRIPQDIFKKLSFYNLETIDLEDSWLEYDESTINCSDSEESGIYPDELTSDRSDIIIPTLRHVYGSIYIKQRLPLKWNEHTNLQTFHDVPLQIELVGELGYCINLRTLVIHNVGDIDNERALKGWQILKGVLRRTEELIYLSIDLQDGGFLPFGGTKDLLCHGKIQKLHLNGILARNICVPCVGMFPTNLAKLMLRFCELQEDPMPILERLQSLRILHLQCDSYVGREFICSTGGFPNLEKLDLTQLPKLCHWDIKEGAMPIISHLKIIDCKELHTVPELQNLRTLRELLAEFPARELRKSMQGKDRHKIEHIPSVRILRALWDNEENPFLT